MSERRTEKVSEALLAAWRLAAVDCSLASAVTAMTGAHAQSVPNRLVRHMIFFGPISIESHARPEQLRALAVADGKRMLILPDVPTSAAAGVHGIETGTWYAVLEPGGPPWAVVERLHDASACALSTTQMRARLNKQGINVVGTSPVELRGCIQTELERCARVVKATKLRVDWHLLRGTRERSTS